MGSPGIAAWGGYVPRYRLPLGMVGAAWGSPAPEGERAVAGPDEDSVTLALAAAQVALARAPNAEVDAVLFASTTSPFAEHSCAATLAAALDVEVSYTADMTGTLRAGTTALRMALELVRAEAARCVLVVAADMRPVEPGSDEEQRSGDAGAALVIGREDVVMEAVDSCGFAEHGPGAWRRAEDRFIRTFEPRLEVAQGYVDVGSRALRDLLERNGRSAADVAALVSGAPSAPALRRLAIAAGFSEGQLADSLLERVGYAGAAHPILALVNVLEQAAGGEIGEVVVLGVGDGADAVLIRQGAGSLAAHDGPTVEALIDSRAEVRSYEEYVEFRRLLPRERPHPWASVTGYWRDRDQDIPLHGGCCSSCGAIQYPPWRGCIECGAIDTLAPVALSRAGTIFTYTLDHLAGGRYLETPIARAVIDLDRGGRIFLELTDSDPDSVAVGERVDLTFRRVHDGSDFPMYYWKAELPRLIARPTLAQPSSSQKEE